MGQGLMALNETRVDLIRYKEEILYSGGGEALAQAAQSSCGCPIPGNVQGQVGWGFGQADLLEGVPALDRALN